jgi:hypothetical protein
MPLLALIILVIHRPLRLLHNSAHVDSHSQLLGCALALPDPLAHLLVVVPVCQLAGLAAVARSPASNTSSSIRVASEYTL